MKVKRIFTSVVMLIVSIATAFSFLPTAQAAEETGATTGVTIGSGVTGRVRETLFQNEVVNKSLELVNKWRADALNDSRIKVKSLKNWPNRITIKQYLKEQNISEYEYTHIKWSQPLERIAIQRAVEVNDIDVMHNRPNNTSTFTAKYNNVASIGEVLAWMGGASKNNVTHSINLWGSEKPDYIKETEGKAHGPSSHYRIMVDPGHKSVGLAFINSKTDQLPGQDDMTVCVGQFSNLTNQSTTPTNWSGTKDFTVKLHQTRVNKGVLFQNIPDKPTVGSSWTAKAASQYMNGRYDLVGTWSSSNSSVISTTSAGAMKANKAGSANITFKTGSSTFTISKTAVSKPVSVTFHANGGSFPGNATTLSKTCYVGSSCLPPSPPTRNMMSVKGWYTAAYGGTAIDINKPLNTTATSLTLYAQWENKRFKDTTAPDPAWMISAGVSYGYLKPDGSFTFEPNSVAQRQDVAEFLYQIARRNDLADSRTWVPTEADYQRFQDVKKDSAHATAVLWLAHAGITTGYNENGGWVFHSGWPMYRQDMAAFMKRMLSLRDTDINSWNPSPSDWKIFKDVFTSTPHYKDILWCGSTGVSKGTVQSDGSVLFKPGDRMIRGEAATFLRRLDGIIANQ